MTSEQKLKKDIELLDECIIHWEWDILLNHELPSSEDCALCQVYVKVKKTDE